MPTTDANSVPLNHTVYVVKPLEARVATVHGQAIEVSVPATAHTAQVTS